MGAAYVVARILQFYTSLIVVYVLMSWFPLSGIFEDIYRVLASVVEPYLGLFRRIIPPIGMIDISPIVAVLVIQLLTGPIVGLVARL